MNLTTGGRSATAGATGLDAAGAGSAELPPSPSSSRLSMTLDGNLSIGVSTGVRHSGQRNPGGAAVAPPDAAAKLPGTGRPFLARSLMHDTQNVC